MIPQADPSAFVRAHRREIDQAIARVLDSGCYIGGPEVAAFERAFAAYLATADAVAVASGTDALHLALRALGIGPGDEVLLPSLTATATAAAVHQTGARPVFVDVKDADLTLDPDLAARAVTPRTKAILGVHLYGQPADLPALQAVADRAGAALVEDCAQSHGAALEGRRTGAWGQAAAFSFYPTKNLGALGDAGLVATSDPALAERLRLLREYGWRERQVSERHGWNSRLDPLQAAILSARLPHLDADNARRREIARAYDRGLRGRLRTPPAPTGASVPVYHQYVVRHPARDRLRAWLEARGVGTAIHYPVPLHLQPAYRVPGAPGLPVAERACAEILSLPVHPELTDAQVQEVLRHIGGFEGQG